MQELEPGGASPVSKVMHEREIFYAAISGTVLALDLDTGEELWRRTLSKGASVTTIYPRGTRVIAAAAGELWGLDARGGEVLWHNKLKGLGLGFVCLTGSPAAAATHAAVSAGSEAALIAAMVATGDCGDSSAGCGGE